MVAVGFSPRWPKRRVGVAERSLNAAMDLIQASLRDCKKLGCARNRIDAENRLDGGVASGMITIKARS